MFDNIGAGRNRAIVALLVDMARSASFSAPMEDQYIFNIANELGVTQEVVKDIQINPRNYPFDPPPSEQERMTILYFLLFTMRADGEIKEDEENYLHDIGLRLGVNPALTGDLIRVIRNYVDKDIPPIAMLDQIKKYLN